MRYLIKIVVNGGNKIRTQDLCFDTKLNNHLTQKFKLIGRDEFNYLIYILAEMRSIVSQNLSSYLLNRYVLHFHFFVSSQFVTTLSVVDTMKKQFYIQKEGIFRYAVLSCCCPSHSPQLHALQWYQSHLKWYQSHLKWMHATLFIQER